MRTIWLVGALVAVVGLLGAARSIPEGFGPWSDPREEVPVAGRSAAVRRQLDARAVQLTKLLAERADSAERAQAIRAHLAWARSPLLLDARRVLDEETAIADRVEGRIRRLVVVPRTAQREAGAMLLLTGVTLLLTGLIGAVISGSDLLAPAPRRSALHATALALSVGAVLFAANTLQELGTSVYAEEKDAFGFASWAVSRCSWTWVRLMALGLCLSFASVLATAWNAAAPECSPVPNARDEDGGFGIVRYVTAWRWWVLLGASASLGIAVGEVLAIAYGRDRFDPWYLLTPTVGLIATAAPVVRAALRIQELRDECRRARWLESTRNPAVPLPDDPTDAFWEVPFKVPAYVLVAASAAWLALEKTGAAGAILRSVGSGP